MLVDNLFYVVNFSLRYSLCPLLLDDFSKNVCILDFNKKDLQLMFENSQPKLGNLPMKRENNKPIELY